MSRFKILMLILLTLCVTANAGAEDNKRSIPISIKASGSFISGSDFKDSKAAVTVAGGKIDIKATGFSFSYEGKNYSWDNVDKLNFGNGVDDPWNTLHRIAIGYSHFGKINKNWFYGAGITGTSAFEEEMSNSFGAAVRGNIGYIFNDNWKALIGARVFTNSVRTSAMPFVSIMYENYKEDGSGIFMTLGALSEAGYAFSNTEKIRFKFGLDGKTYRLKNSSTVASKGYITTSSMMTGAYFDWKPFKGFSLSVGPEYYFAREMKTYDEHGNKFGGASKQDAAIGGSLTFGYKF
ncbi:hypothetical protein SAMN05660337_0907 [Maridesulfovibrio ferrireducens]|uniref:Outer membrane protein beta-barrel domain-containing protein n=1 Tax=Maridesulfovibrio ferrireducens TaxID=246191 RepID=A0A1G9D4I6_9BACT|nr:hypothetical protein [Maridesulfovibrio ferrireducens]SDK58829.1 hypothetical protein SAMN05660337_0907 [Maridesulfovibrio ferrireducens]